MKKFLLGTNKEGKKEYLIVASWDCGWYWGFGYVQSFERGDIYEHQHFDGLFLKNNIFDSFIERYGDTSPLSKDKIWELLSFMKEFYIMNEYAELLKHGGYITSRAIGVMEEKNKIQNEIEINRINNVLLPELFKKIYELWEQ